MAATSPAAAYDDYRLIDQSLRRLQKNGWSAVEHDKAFRHLSSDEFPEAMRVAKDRLDRMGVLEVSAAIEAVIQLDFKVRLGLPAGTHGADPSTVRTVRNRIDFEGVLDFWKEEILAGAVPSEASKMGELKQLYRHRHWHAHGRYFDDRSGVHPDVRQALETYRRVERAIKTVDPAFPLR